MSFILCGLGLALGACRGECITNLNFPRCEYKFDKTTVYVHELDGLTQPTHFITESPKLTLKGDSSLGTNWVGQVHGDRVWLGLPEMGTVAALSYSALFECSDNPGWLLENTSQVDGEVSLIVRPEDTACTVAPLLFTHTEADDFGHHLLSTVTPQGEEWLWVGAPNAEARQGVVGLYAVETDGLTRISPLDGS